MTSIYVNDTAAGKSVSAYVIMKGKRHVATVTAHFGNSRVLVNIRQDIGEFQHASASGYGYDKFTAALAGLTIDGHKMTNHCGGLAKPPKGLKYFPADYKAPRGYSLANYGDYDAVTGERLDSYTWRNIALAEMGESADWEAVQRRGRELKGAANTVAGYSSCYRKEGLKYLEAIGYTVIQAL